MKQTLLTIWLLLFSVSFVIAQSNQEAVTIITYTYPSKKPAKTQSLRATILTNKINKDMRLTKRRRAKLYYANLNYVQSKDIARIEFEGDNAKLREEIIALEIGLDQAYKQILTRRMYNRYTRRKAMRKAKFRSTQKADPIRAELTE